MPRLDPASDSLPGRRSALRGPLACAAVLVAAVAACECDGVNIGDASPVIEVTPNPVTGLEGVPGRVTSKTLQVRNVGRSDLVFAKDPYFVEKDGTVDEFGVSEKFQFDCESNPRSSDSLAPGECALLVFRYLPKADGVDEAELHFETNDPDSPDYVVPIHASALTPDIEVCAYNGDIELGCNVPGSELEVDFGTSPPGEAVVRTLKLRSQGSRPVDVSSVELSGDPDYDFTPAPFAKQIAAGAEEALTVTFDARSGGFRLATMTIRSNDPDEESVTVRLRAVGDGAALCTCIGSATEACRPATTVNFGDVPVGGSGDKFLRVSSCGTRPLTLTKVAVSHGAPAFVVDAAAVGTSLGLEPGDPHVDLPLSFRPTDAQRYSGRLDIEMTNERGAEKMFLTLDGVGVENGCALVAVPAVVDFGLVQLNTPGEREVTLRNQGRVDCSIEPGTRVTVGANAKFELASQPPAVVPASGFVRFTVRYVPGDQTPDVGELVVPYRADEPGAALTELKLQLKGNGTPTPVCQLTAQPAATGAFGRSLNFGQVRVNTEKVMPVTFQNTGSSACTLTGARIASSFLTDPENHGKAFRIVTPPKGTLMPGESTTVEVGFKPTADVFYGMELPSIPFPGGGGIGGMMGPSVQVTTSDQTSFPSGGCGGLPPGPAGCVAWGLSGQGAKSNLAVLPPDVNFGLVTVGCRSREIELTLYNVGGAPVKIEDFIFDPPEARTVFQVTTPAVPFTMQGGEQRKIIVRYRPGDTRIHTASIFIKSDATNTTTANPYITVSLRGEGTFETHQTDTFDQNARPKTDVLFVIDNSGSMSEEQSALATNAEAFLNAAQALNTDYQMGVVTTDVVAASESGRLQGNPKIITNATQNGASVFRNTVRSLGTNGSATERGLDAMVAALTDPLINNENKGFLRTDAKLAVVVVSDEDDFSTGSVDFYTDFLKNLKGIHNAPLVSLSAIVGDSPNGCSSSNGDATAGKRYIEVQKRTGGEFRSICSGNWSQIARDLGLDAFGARAGFPLSRVPEPDTIKVKVNGAPAPNAHWSYEGPTNTVVFDPNHVPAAAATIVIDYEAACL